MTKRYAPAAIMLFCAAVFFFAAALCSTPALAKENGSTITTTEIVRVTTSTNNNLISGRVNSLQGPDGKTQQGDGGTASDQRSKVPGSKYLISKEYLNANVLPQANFASKLQSISANSTNSPAQWPSFLAMAMDTMAQQSKQALSSEQRWGVWGMPSVAWLSSPSSTTKFNGILYSFMGGVDYKITDRFLVGMGLGYEYLALRTSFNNGHIYENGLTAMPYAAYMITNNTILDTSLGLTAAHYNTTRDYNVTGKYDATRTSWGTNLTQYFPIDKLTMSARLGHLYSNEYRPTYWESDNRRPVLSGNTYVGELQLGGNVSYAFERITPFLGATYVYDYALRNAKQMDPDELQGTLGVTFKATDALLLNLQLTNSFFRENMNNTRVLLNMRYEF